MGLEDTVDHNLPAIVEEKADRVPYDPEHAGFVVSSLFLGAMAGIGVAALCGDKENFFHIYLGAGVLSMYLFMGTQVGAYELGRRVTNYLYENGRKRLQNSNNNV